MVLSPGRSLKILLAVRDLTAREVARRAGLSEFQVSRYLNDRIVRPDPAVLERIRSALHEPDAS